MSAAALQTSAVGSFPSGFTFDLSAHRAAMLRFARRKIRDENLAEDAVQDALVAALASRESFKGRSAFRTWLIGILNHKIQDLFRRETRYVRQLQGLDQDDAVSESIEMQAAAMEVSDQHDPATAVAQRRMHEELIRQVELLPKSLREVFMLQVVEGLSTEEVCARLKITEANCWVRLHRARKRLSERMREYR